MQFCCLGSGSKGNATLVRFNEQLIMIDCGFSFKTVAKAMQEKGCAPEELTAVLVTHEHSDHIQGVNTLAKRLSLPVYCTPGTYYSGKLKPELDVRFVKDGQTVNFNGLAATAVTVPHDANEPCQFYFTQGSKKLGVLTDLGLVSAHVQQAFAKCDALLLEANHDVEMLMQGPYPPSLKRRVASDWGHLNNQQAAHFLGQSDISNLGTLVLGHISEKNNTLEKVKQHFEPYAGQIKQLLYACQAEGFNWQTVT